LGNFIYLQNLVNQEKIFNPTSGTIFFVAKIIAMEDVKPRLVSAISILITR
jgi:hypothetical protein